MSQQYLDPTQETDPYSLPNIETFQLTAREAAEQDEDLIWEYMKRREFRLAAINGKVRDRMFDAIVEEQGIKGGWFYWFCLPGCLPDSNAFGPYNTEQEALEAAREEWGD